MALRSSTYLKAMIGHLRGTSNFTTSTTPKMKAFAPSLDIGQSHDIKARLKKGDFVPVCMAIGMIAVSTGLGIYTATQQLRHSPNVFVKKSRRETIPEVVEPEHVVEDADKFIKKSFFRKVAHIQDKTRKQVIISDPNIIYRQPPRAETLKDVGVDPMPH